ncbi:MAG: carboxypeptidase-like regulatory domain-containing protein, partial [Acidobacteriota bacterium]
MTMILRSARWTFVAVLFLILGFTSSVLVPRCLAQAVAVAQVGGVISDPSGSSIPGAQVKITQTETQLSRATVSDTQGRYVLPNLPVGPYRLEVTASGFKAYAQSGIVLQVGNNVQINVAMQIGAIAETVEVNAQTVMVETSQNTVSQIIDAQRIEDLPLNGRVPTQLILMAGASVYNVQPSGQDVVGS